MPRERKRNTEHQMTDQRPADADAPTRSSRRPDMIRQRREEQLRRDETERRRRLLTIVGLAVFGLVAAALVVGFASLRSRSDTAASSSAEAPAGVETFADLSRDHVDGPVAYAQMPPVGGEHAPAWQNCDFYTDPVGNEHAVHSLEHGAVWVTYGPDLPADQIDALRRLAADEPYLLVSPFPGLPVPVVASAWGQQLRLDAADDPRLVQFLRAFAQGPQTPEPGAPCTGGTSETA
jgi:hypothetical protein